MSIVIQTSRLIIEPFDMKYLDDYYAEFNAEITRYQYPDPFSSKEDAKESLQHFVDLMNQGKMLFLSVLTKDKRFIGGVEVHGLREEEPELGVWIIKDFQRKGYAFEALSNVMEYVNHTFQKEWYIYEADIRNESSMKLVEKFENHKEGLYEFTTKTGKELKLQTFLIK